jgi:hypothetical protein
MRSCCKKVLEGGGNLLSHTSEAHPEKFLAAMNRLLDDIRSIKRCPLCQKEFAGEKKLSLLLQHLEEAHSEVWKRVMGKG